MGELDAWKETQEVIARNSEQGALKDSMFFSLGSYSVFVVWNFSRVWMAWSFLEEKVMDETFQLSIGGQVCS